MKESPYESPKSLEINSDDIALSRPKPGPVLIGLVVVILMVNAFLSFTVSSLIAGPNVHSIGYSVGYVAGQVIFFPLLVVGLFQIGRRFRNSRSRHKIFFWSSLLVLLSILGNLGTLV